MQSDHYADSFVKRSRPHYSPTMNGAPVNIANLPKRVAESWIWYVFNPQIEHCTDELDTLARDLTFRSGSRRFERLLTMREALAPAGRAVFDDMQGELSPYDALVDRHDDALRALQATADALYAALLRDEPFRNELDRLLAERKGRSRHLPESVGADPAILGYIAERIVNGLGPDLDPRYVDHELWNAECDRLKTFAPAELVAERDRQRADFAESVEAARQGIVRLRKEISRSLDIPVVPVG
jgi:hypothetical protein